MSARCPAGHESAATDYCDTCGVSLLAPAAPTTAATKACPQGHSSAAADYCDSCGSPMSAPGASVTSAAPPSGDIRCSHCSANNIAAALFCESCGYDFTTGALPVALSSEIFGHEAAPLTAPEIDNSMASPVGTAASGGGNWVVEIWVDPAWFTEQESEQPCPSPGLPREVPLKSSGALIGRTSSGRNIHPEVDCVADIGVSRRHAQLSTDGTRWWVEDLGSANGTFVAAASAPLPTEPIPAGQARELREDERIYLGAWTRLVLRPSHS